MLNVSCSGHPGWMRTRSGCSFAILLALLLGTLEPRRALAQTSPVITEVMADNGKTLADEDDDFEDWVELFNPGDAEIDLEGYYLTDNAEQPKKWAFPAVHLAARSFLVVFCSGKDRSDPALELHTSFSLDSSGEDILLLAPNGTTVVSGFTDYPEQIPDVSFGVQMAAGSVTPVARGTPVRVLVPSSDIGIGWTTADFDDAGWRAGTLAVGYGGTAPESGEIGTDVGADMLNINGSVYVRAAFDLPDPVPADIIKLRIKYDDGYAAFLNGQPVASANAPVDLLWSSLATKSHTARLVETVDLSQHTSALRPGRNVLALQGMNFAANNNDLFILPEVEIVDVGPLDPNVRAYFPTATPGSVNLVGFPSAAPAPTVSQESGVFVESLTVTLSTDLAGGVIRYTLDDTVPAADSPEYTAPFEVKSAVRMTARVFKDGMAPGILARRTYIGLDPAFASFNSNLPILFCTTFGRPVGANCGGGPYTAGYIVLIEPGPGGRANIVDEAKLSNYAGFRRRGSSTCGFNKFAFNIEFWDSEKRDKNVEVFDFPRESDYLCHGGNNFDRAMVRNPIAYWMSREVGWWAARSRFVDVIMHQSRNLVRTSDYFGIYAFMEKNKQNPDKVAISEISSRDNTEPAVSGGYLFRRDRVGEGEVQISGGGYGSLVFVYPKKPSSAQSAYMTAFLNRTIPTLKPTIGSQEDNDAIDFLSFVDHHILCWYPKNVDAFRLSGYFYKERDGRLYMGPVWDYDRTMGCSDDDRARDPLGWHNDQVGDGGTRYFESGGLGSWYSLLFNNTPPTKNTRWDDAYRKRWRQLRAGPLRSERIAGQLDLWTEELKESAPRNYQKWPSQAPRFGGFQGEMTHLKNWLLDRGDWIDSQFIESPDIVQEGGIVLPGFQVEITISNGAAIYYTIDGNDPKGPDGLPSPTAVEYKGPFTISRNARVATRSLDQRLWSSLVTETFVTAPPKLALTELMFKPLPPTPEEDPTGTLTAIDMEFIELTNVGTQPAQLLGVTFATGVTYDITGDRAGADLAPGESIVFVRNPDAFAARYGRDPAVRVFGPYDNNLSDTAERLRVNDPLGDPIASFTYRSSWYAEANGGGHSLVNVDPLALIDTLGDPAAWRISAAVHGTPGRQEGSTPGGRRLPGDANGDAKRNVSDAILLLGNLFQGLNRLPCAGDIAAPANETLLDWSGDGTVDAADAIAALTYLFRAGPAHAAGIECLRLNDCTEACGG